MKRTATAYPRVPTTSGYFSGILHCGFFFVERTSTYGQDLWLSENETTKISCRNASSALVRQASTDLRFSRQGR